MSNANMNVDSVTTSGSSGFWLWMGILSLPVLWAVYWGALSIFSSEDFTALGNKTPWGLYITAYAFLVVSTSIGACFVGSLGSVFEVEQYVVIEKRAVFLAVVALVAGMSLMLVELGQPIRILRGYTDTPNPSSPIFGMGVIYSLDLVLVSCELVLLFMDNMKWARRFGVLALCTATAAGSTVGSVFGLAAAKPYWNGPYLPIDFILCAWITGFAIMIIASFSAAKRNVRRAELLSLVHGMGTWLAVFLAVELFFVLWTTSTGLYGGGTGDKYLATAALVKGPLRATFWGGEIVLGIIVPLVLLVVPGMKNPGTTYTAAILAVIGMFASKVNLLQAPLTIPVHTLGRDISRMYFPSMVEISIVAGAIACVLVAYSVVERYGLLTHEA